MKIKDTLQIDIGNEKNIKVAVVKPTPQQDQEAQLVYNKVFARALKSEAILRMKLDQVMRDQNLWDDKKQAEFDRLRTNIGNGEITLKKGGISLSDARKIAIDMKKNRLSLLELLSERNSLDNHTAEAQSENAKFDYFVSCCAVFDTEDHRNGQPIFTNYNDYIAKKDEDYAFKVASKFATIFYNYDEDFQLKLPENEFLQKYKFVDSKLRFVDKEGRLTDDNGKHIDEDGKFIKYNEDGTTSYININGDLLTKDGDPLIEFSPFLDEGGQPILDDIKQVAILEDVKPSIENTLTLNSTGESPIS